MAQTNKKAADDLWAAAQATIAATNAILTQGQTSLAAAQQMVTDCQTIINGVTPGQPLPINTTTDLTGSCLHDVVSLFVNTF